MFVLTNDKNYLGYNAVNKIISTLQEENAIHFATKEKAINALNNLPKTLAHLGYYVKSIQEDIEFNNEAGTIVKEGPTELVATFPQFDELCNYLKEFEDMYIHIINSKNRLEKELELCEDEQQDIIHAIEFRARNASEGYKMYKALYELRNNRRKIKDSLLTIQILEETFGSNLKNTRASDRLKGMRKRRYLPRKNYEIFS